ncbi:MAG: MarR family transcriptional regulator [Acidobacteriota bacterium]
MQGELFDPRQSLGFQCLLTYRAFRAALERRLKHSGVSSTQFIALAHLVSLGPLPQAELAAQLGITPASAVRLVDRMERDGWVRREAAPQDRRINLVVATDAALEVWRELSQHAWALLKEAYAGIDPAQIAGAIALLERVRRNLGAEL